MPFFKMHDGSIAHVSLAGPERVIEVDGTLYRFEDHPVCGPTPLNKRGDPRHLRQRHRFWTAVTQWYEGGKKLDAQGRAIWEEAADPDEAVGYVRIGRNLFPRAMAARLGYVEPANDEQEKKP